MRRTLVVMAVVGAGLSLTLAQPASAEETTCVGAIGAVTVDNLRVPEGATCILEGTHVQGTIKVERAASLQASNVTVIGNVQAENASDVRVAQGSTVGGSVQVVKGQAASVADSTITGDILYDENSGALSAERNHVGGNIQAFKNTGGLIISGNRVDGNLQCKENQPPPTGGENIVQGNKEDQCARL